MLTKVGLKCILNSNASPIEMESVTLSNQETYNIILNGKKLSEAKELKKNEKKTN